MTNLVQDLNVLTNIPEKSFNKLINLSYNSICSTIWEDEHNGNDITKIDIGIGKLSIKHVKETGEVKYHFEPSDILRREIKHTIQCDANPITLKLNTSLQSKFTEVYKEIC